MSDETMDAASAALLQSLRQHGLPLRDPIRFCYLQAMAVRAERQPPAVREVLLARLAQAVADCQEPDPAGAPHPEAPTRHGVGPGACPLAELNRYIAQQSKPPAADPLSGDTGSPSDMKSVRRFAALWSRIATEQQLARALTRGPEQAGPLNSHRLVLRAMSLMQGLSPDYLRRFLAQSDALLWLDQMNQQMALKAPAKGGAKAAAKSPSKPAAKPAPRRGGRPKTS